MEILQPKPEHAGEIARLNEAVQKLHAEHHPDVFKYPTNAAETEKFFRETMSADDNFIFVATLAGHACRFFQPESGPRGESVGGPSAGWLKPLASPLKRAVTLWAGLGTSPEGLA